ncbi:MAG: electron transfer flavoprotein subunit alpha/FixB family protein [Dehalococcoidales bacterium]|nr:electron transfer flavoprotein subunit alpha/FixB family protein [Dehalococcoidales bacterium]
MNTVKQVWVWAEHYRGSVNPAVLGLLGKARELAHEIDGGSVGVVLAGADSKNITDELFNYGADFIYLADDTSVNLSDTESCARLVAELARQYQPEIVLWGATGPGKEIAARTAVRLNTGLTAHCIALDIVEIDGRKQLAASVSGWGGSAVIRITCPKQRPQMVTVKAGIFTSVRPEKRTGKIIHVKITQEPARLETIEVIEATASAGSLEQAEVVVAAGWGMNSLGGIAQAEELANLLGGSVGGTRPAVDAGWISHDRMIGQSGISVAPRLLITLGVSGAAQFASTVTGAKFILAIDKNPDAPIFEMADLGIAGDLQEILPRLITKIRAVKGKSWTDISKE